MRRCTKCIQVDTKPGFTINESGVCNACQTAKKQDKVDWSTRWQDLESLARRAQLLNLGRYNIVIPVSGGKDSTYLAFTARDRLGLRPLCVNVAPCEPTERGERNFRNLSEQGFDVFRFYPNAKIMPQLVKRSFYEDGDPCTSHEFMLYGVPLQMAINFKVPLIMWAENSQTEYGNPDVVCGLWGRNYTHWVGDGITEKDLISFRQPTQEEITESGIRQLYLSDYERWDSHTVADFAIEHGLEIRDKGELMGTGGYWDFEQLDDESPVIGHCLKYMKFGYGRATDQACRDIRLGRITREEGLDLANQYDGRLSPDYIKNFCKYIGIDEPEFHKVMTSFYRKPVELS